MADKKIKLQKWNETTKKWEVFDADGLGGSTGSGEEYTLVFDDGTKQKVKWEEVKATP